MHYHKLVRDRIIERIEAKGERAIWHTATDEEYHERLLAKLDEEVREFTEACSPEEMSDIFEVITALLAEQGWALEDIVALQKQKRKERGGFDRKIILEETW
ncbi:MAG: nucleoside triphosphate pyrophosphohydrolase [Candidatus Moranbacteria bacterium]|nr:nucleoside triphosphate pyrophosphohydrolase [Candidatus Moranbacteria bacterium]MBP9801552.1 nucleoside triphosphate pyrophosphohydrolase [Candidatus Moranbacteria bacterium]